MCEKNLQWKSLNLPTFEQTFTDNYQAAVLNIMAGRHPQLPVNLNHRGLWEVMKICWSEDPKKRPTTSQLLEFFRES